MWLEIDQDDTCRECRTVQHHPSSASGVSLSVIFPQGNPFEGRDPVNLNDLIEAKFSAEAMPGACQGCGRQDSRDRTSNIVATPDMLCVRLTRTHQQRRPFRLRKLYRPVNIPLTLDLSRYMEGSLRGHATYRLYAIAKHKGKLNTGHYIAWAKCPTGWHELDDSQYSNSTAAEARSQALPTKKKQSEADLARIFTPYLLFYEREYYAD